MIPDVLKPFLIPAHSPGISTGTVFPVAHGDILSSYSPVDGSLIAELVSGNKADFDSLVKRSAEAFLVWSRWPAPKRGEVIRQIGVALRSRKPELGRLVSLEMGKSLQEGLGEVQEMIDICDFAVGLSRQLHGLTMHSERPDHRMYEQWHPLGIIGVISAFNFPVAVWSWNAMLAWVCGNTVIWKPSEKTPVTALACQQIISGVFLENQVPEGVSCLFTGGKSAGQWMAEDPHIPLISATGSVRMGKEVGKTVAARLGRTLLELGGNNAIIISEKGDQDLALNACLFGAVGTAGQRCTTTRRLIIQESIYESFTGRLVQAYSHLRIGNPLNPDIHMGPLIDKGAVKAYLQALEEIRKEGGIFVLEGGVLTGPGYESGCYVKPCIAEVKNDLSIVQQETFAPILYLIRYSNLQEAIRYQNDVPQGLSSAIITTNLREAEQFLSSAGSDCGIANVNIGTSGAEIGGAFGGEKDTGGGRESGSDAWKNYMRRQTSTINYGTAIPLAQGIHFDP
ncbi:MAG TPA: aldehyde dehydrogenase family protein [Chitinophagaceae bacterium]|nr:aldehyde dehydrogenase family protein [Chitinophagaceae bacterium]